MLKLFAICLTASLLCVAGNAAQNATSAAAKSLERITGTVTAIDQSAHTVTVKEDKTGTEYSVALQNAKNLLKVEPTAKDLKNAVKITADDLAVGDRVQIFGLKSAAAPNGMVARDVILMSARDLQQAHQEEAAAWQHSTPGVVTGIDTAANKLTISARTSSGLTPLVVDAANAQFTRYSPEAPKTPVASRLTDIQPGDQVRIIGERSADGSSIVARDIYSSSFRTLVGTVSSISPDGKEIVIKNLQNKQPVTVALNDESAIRKLPPMLAYGLARRFNPDFKPQGGGPNGSSSRPNPGNSAGAPPAGEHAGEGANGNPAGAHEGGAGPGGMHGAANGDLSQMLDRLPKISAQDLKPGDAVVVSGSPTGNDNSHLLATNVIAGVEPIFQSASPRQAQSLGNWGASLSGGGMDTGEGMPGGSPQ